MHRLGLARNPGTRLGLRAFLAHGRASTSLPVVFGFVGKMKSRYTRLRTQQRRKMRDAKNNEEFVPLPTVRLDARQTDVILAKHSPS